MNEASDINDEKNNTTEENIFLPNISSDNNANPNDSNNLKRTGAIPKITQQNTLNGVTSEVRIKLNNNLHETSLKNGGPNLFKDTYVENNVDGCSFGKPSPINNFDMTPTNGFKCSSKRLSVDDIPTMGYTFTNGIKKNEQKENLHGSATLPVQSNLSEPGPSSVLHDIGKLPPSMLDHALRELDSDEYSSDTGNDELSCCDDCCIYTYKGDVADLPRSFMNLDPPENNDGQENSRAGSRGSSPEMDFLEMDFDPGPSCDAESDESSTNLELKQEDNIPQSCEKFDDTELQPGCPIQQLPINELVADKTQFKVAIREDPQNNLDQQNMPSTSRMIRTGIQNVRTNVVKPSTNNLLLENFIDIPWLPKSASQRTLACSVVQDSKGHHSSSGDLISPSENILPSTSSLECRINTSSSLYHSTMEKQLVLDKKPTSEHTSCIEKTMIWTEQQAALKQITQISTSACGATSVINVLLALGHEVSSKEEIIECVSTRLRANASPLLQYLKSRSSAGSTHKDLIIGLHKISEGKIFARFFHMFPERYVNLSQWLSYWIKKGAVPIATLNLQKGICNGSLIPDAWHHQMVFGVGPHGIYLTNPLECVEEGLLWHQLTSESVLLVRREDIVSRFNYKTSLKELMSIRDVRWRRLNVVGQMAHVIREHCRGKPGNVGRTHISIPASYSAGITLAINVNNPAYELLKTCPELPTLYTQP